MEPKNDCLPSIFKYRKVTHYYILGATGDGELVLTTTEVYSTVEALAFFFFSIWSTFIPSKHQACPIIIIHIGSGLWV